MALPPLASASLEPLAKRLAATDGKYTDVPDVMAIGDTPGKHGFAILCPQPVAGSTVSITMLERHPHSTQSFIPIRGNRWLVVLVTGTTATLLVAISVAFYGSDAWLHYEHNIAVLRRVILEDGTGVSHRMVIEDMFGYSFAQPARHMREYLEVLLPLLRDGAAKFAGQTVTADITLSTPRPHRTPVLLAALAPKMLRLAGTVAHQLARAGSGVGVATLCIGVGQGLALVLER